jgi:probable phosphoglycerate mutase
MKEKAKTTLLAVRHGETVWNAESRFQGHGDSPLTETGRRQARALGERMRGIDFDVLISSDLGRAKETALIITSFTGHSMHTDFRLRERNFGALEGLTKEEIQDRHPEVYERLYADDPDYAPPEGETHRGHFERNLSFINELVAERPGITAVLVGHGGLLDTLFRFAAKLPLRQPRCFVIPNTSLSRFTYGTFYGTRRWVIESWGDVAHLQPTGGSMGAHFAKNA